MSDIFARTEIILGKEKAELLQGKRVVVFGLGGVGGTAAETLLRSGVGHLILVDCDTVQPSNLNRQILYCFADVGKPKTDCAVSHLQAIIPKSEIIAQNYRVNEISLNEHSYVDCDYIIDALDDVSAKVALIVYSIAHNVPIITSLGMANRLNPSLVRETTLDRTSYDPLAKRFRSELRKRDVDIAKVHCVSTGERPAVRQAIPASMMMVPSSSGLLLAYIAIANLVK